MSRARSPQPLSLAICTNRPSNVGYMAATAASMAPGDELIVVVDLPAASMPESMAKELDLPGVRLVHNGTNRGLSYSRNQALAECAHRVLVYIDDDVTVSVGALDAIRQAAAAGAGIIGILLVPVFPTATQPWWLTGGQYHYLGVHHGAAETKTWGACMAVDVGLANRHSVRFRQELGRRGRALQSGDDTTFLAELRAVGTTESFLSDVCASHHISRCRQRFRYLVRRAWWQGRSERRRHSLFAAILKEWRRNVGRGPAAASPPRRLALAAIYLASVIAGGCYEALVAPLSRMCSR